MKLLALLIIGMSLAIGGCKQKPPPDETVHIKPRTDFAPEDFGVGRKHTRNASCNAEIDQLLDQVRECYGTRTTAVCEVMQTRNSDKIGRLKNSSRCSH